MFANLADLYRQNIWFKISTGVALLLSGEILFWASGGFPPWAWRFLFQVMMELPALWSAQGSAILIPLFGLFLLSLALLLMWLVILVFLVKMVISWVHVYSARQDLQQAEQLSARMFQQEVSRRGPKRASSRAPRTAQLEPATYPPVTQRARATYEPDTQSAKMAAQPRQAVSARSVYQPGAYQPVAEQARSYQPTVEAAQEESFEDAWKPRSMPLFPQNEMGMQPYSVARASRPVRAAAGQNYTTSYPAASAGAPPARRDQLRIVPREPVEEQPDYETLFEIEHPLIETSDPRLTTSKLVQDVRTDSLKGPIHTEELQNTLRLVVGIGLDPGIARKDSPNEDNLFAIQAMRAGKNGVAHPVGLFMVADGMGGHADGQEASRLAIQVMSDAIVPVIMRVDADEDSFSDLLKDGVHRANLALYQRNREVAEMMGTTLTAVLMVDDQAYVANIGDSRTYLYRPQDGLRPVTRDHSLVAQLVEQGHITRDEVYTHPRRNQIYRCLGEKPSVEVDNFHLTIQRDDVLMLCSDGLWEMVRDDTIQKVIASSSAHPSQISSMLVQSALSRGGADNISVVVVCVTQPEEQG